MLDSSLIFESHTISCFATRVVNVRTKAVLLHDADLREWIQLLLLRVLTTGIQSWRIVGVGCHASLQNIGNRFVWNISDVRSIEYFHLCENTVIILWSVYGDNSFYIIGAGHAALAYRCAGITRGHRWMWAAFLRHLLTLLKGYGHESAALILWRCFRS